MTMRASKLVLAAALVVMVGAAVPTYAASKSTDSNAHSSGGSGSSTSPAVRTTLTAESAGHVTMSDFCLPVPCYYPTGVTESVAATLTYPVSGYPYSEPLSGATIRFTLDHTATGDSASGWSCTRTTLDNGVATCALSAQDIANTAGDTFVAHYDGLPGAYQSSSSAETPVFEPHVDCGGSGVALNDCH